MYESADPHAAPHVYRLKTITRLFSLSAAAFYIFLAGMFLEANAGSGFTLVISLLFLLPAIYMVSSALRTRLTLDGDRIEYRSALRTFTATRDQIEGFRTIRNRYGRFFKIYLKDNHGSFTITRSLTGISELNTWLQGVTNLDQRDAEEIKSEISQQQTMTYGTADPSQLLRKARIWMFTLSAVAVAAGVVAFLHPAPYFLAAVIVLWLLPFIATLLLYRFPLLYTIFKTRADPRADLTVAIFISTLALLFASFSGRTGHIVDASQLLLWFAFIFLVFVAAIFRPAWNSPTRWGALIGLLVFAGMYSYGVIHTADTVPDHSVARPYRAQILRMYETDGRDTDYYLTLAPWGPMTSGNVVDVSLRIYNQVRPGEDVCLGLHPGYLHAAWYTLTPCSQ